MTDSKQPVIKRGHPGAGRKRTGKTPRGRQVDPQSRVQVRALLGDEPLRRDLLIEYLHLIQDTYGHLSARHLAALAEVMRLSQAEVYEVATFYAHFDVISEGEDPPPPVTLRVCDGVVCEMAGSRDLLAELIESAGPEVRLLRAPCMGRCDRAPVTAVGRNHLVRASTGAVLDAMRDGHTEPRIPDYIDYDAYVAAGGYRLLRECLSGRRTFEAVISALEQSELRGLGGAGFPTGRKWRIVRAFEGPRLMVVNCDEGEPGTFKDRHYLEKDPHRFLEGMLIAARVVEAKTCYLYVRDEYAAIRALIKKGIACLEAGGLTRDLELQVRRGAGAYICGEESAMIESIEGKRGLPRNRPPYVAEVGLFGRPTLVNNAETLFWVRDILERGPDWFAGAGRNGCKGWRSYSVSGRVSQPGVKLAPAGISVRELIDAYCGGMQNGHSFKAYLPGGASGGILPASLGDLPLDFGTLEPYGCFIGSAAVVVFSDRDNMKNVALNLMRFFEDESCGQCTPCRVGTEKAVALMARDRWDRDLLSALSKTMADASICGLGQAAGKPIDSLLRYFREDLA